MAVAMAPHTNSTTSAVSQGWARTCVQRARQQVLDAVCPAAMRGPCEKGRRGHAGMHGTAYLGSKRAPCAGALLHLLAAALLISST